MYHLCTGTPQTLAGLLASLTSNAAENVQHHSAHLLDVLLREVLQEVPPMPQGERLRHRQRVGAPLRQHASRLGSLLHILKGPAHGRDFSLRLSAAQCLLDTAAIRDAPLCLVACHTATRAAGGASIHADTVSMVNMVEIICLS